MLRGVPCLLPVSRSLGLPEEEQRTLLRGKEGKTGMKEADRTTDNRRDFPVVATSKFGCETGVISSSAAKVGEERQENRSPSFPGTRRRLRHQGGKKPTPIRSTKYTSCKTVMREPVSLLSNLSIYVARVL